MNYFLFSSLSLFYESASPILFGSWPGRVTVWHTETTSDRQPHLSLSLMVTTATSSCTFSQGAPPQPSLPPERTPLVSHFGFPGSPKRWESKGPCFGAQNRMTSNYRGINTPWPKYCYRGVRLIGEFIPSSFYSRLSGDAAFQRWCYEIKPLEGT